MSNWEGYAVSINCGDPLGCYQGTILMTDGATITLSKPFRNGFPYPKTRVTLNAADIKYLEIIEESQSEPEVQTHSTVAFTKNNKKGQRATVCENLQANQSNVPTTVNNQQYVSNTNSSHAAKSTSVRGGGSAPSRSKPIDIQESKNNKIICHSGSAGAGGSLPKGRVLTERARRRNEACFGDAADPALLRDFDFEGNLALFDKRALWEEMRGSGRPDVVRGADEAGARLRCDESVLPAPPPAPAQPIHVPEELRAAQDYRTEGGVVVPGASCLLRRRLWRGLRGAAGASALALLARAAADVCVRLVGGGRRLEAANAHQAPVAVVLAGPHRFGAAAVLAARLLASHGARALVLRLSDKPCAELHSELELFSKGFGTVLSRLEDLPRPDLVLLALHDPEQPSENDDADQYREALEWARGLRGLAVALEPPEAGWAGLNARASVLALLPPALAPALGRLYLADVAPPPQLFRDLGVRYRPPFGAATLLSLHPHTQPDS